MIIIMKIGIGLVFWFWFGDGIGMISGVWCLRNLILRYLIVGQLGMSKDEPSTVR